MAEEESKTSEAGSSSDNNDASGKSDASADTSHEVEVEVPAQFKKLVEEVEKMTVLELNELVKVLEKKFGVSAQAAVVQSGAGASEGESEEKSIFAVELTAAGDQKIAVIKAIKAVLGLGLKEAKDMVDGVPTMLKDGVEKKEAEEIKGKIEEAGGKITLK